MSVTEALILLAGVSTAAWYFVMGRKFAQMSDEELRARDLTLQPRLWTRLTSRDPERLKVVGPDKLTHEHFEAARQGGRNMMLSAAVPIAVAVGVVVSGVVE